MLIMAVNFWTEENHLFFAQKLCGQIGVAPKKSVADPEKRLGMHDVDNGKYFVES